MTQFPPPIALTMGDPAGIGPDITLHAFAQRKQYALAPFYVLADPDILTARCALLGLDTSLLLIGTVERIDDSFGTIVRDTFRSALPIVALKTKVATVAGTPATSSAAGVLESISEAVQDVHRGRASAVVTNPIAKDVLYRAGFSHPGHTEFLAELARTYWGESYRSVMMLVADDLRVVPVTIHVPLRDVPDAVSPELLRATLDIVLRALRDDFGVAKPHVACAGLNPHAGENGTIGTEDRDIIAPVIAELVAAGHDVTGPCPADTMFHPEARAGVDCIVGMYHDQALIPIKTLAFDRGVNVTLGLPFVRTSPDHGTAFGIAGSGKANPRSLIEAIKLAERMAKLRAGSASQ